MRRRNLARMEQADEERRRAHKPTILHFTEQSIQRFDYVGAPIAMRQIGEAVSLRGAGGTIGQAIEPSAGPAQMPPLAPAPSKRGGWPKGKPRGPRNG